MLEFIVTCGLTFYSLVRVEVLLCGCLHSAQSSQIARKAIKVPLKREYSFYWSVIGSKIKGELKLSKAL